MTAIHETVYPRIRSSITEKELVEIYTPEAEELEFAEANTKNRSTKLGLLILLKLFQRLGYFPDFETVPRRILEYIAAVADLAEVDRHLEKYAKGQSRFRHMILIRDFLKIKSFRDGGVEVLEQVMVMASYTRDILADIINVAIEEMVKERYELPSFDTLLRVARNARAKVNKGFYDLVFNGLTQDQKILFESVVQREKDEQRSTWQLLKLEPKRPTLKNVRSFTQHLEWLQSLNTASDILDGIPETKFKRFAEEAKSLDLTHINETQEKKRFTLIVSLISVKTAEALDDLADMLIRTVQGLHTKGRNALDEYRAKHQERADYLVGLLKNIVSDWALNEEQDLKTQALEVLSESEIQEILEQCEAHMAHSKNKYIPFLSHFYKTHRANLFKLIELLQPISITSEKSLENAIAFLLQHKNAKVKDLSVVETLALSWVPEKWWQSVTQKTSRQSSITTVDRKYFELCLFSCVMQELKSGDLCVLGADKYGDYQNQLVTWDEYDLEIDDFCQRLGYSPEPEQFIQALKTHMAQEIKATDKTFPENSSASLKDGVLSVKKIQKKKEPPGFKIIDRLLLERIPELNIVDVLSDTEHWLNWTSQFGLISGFETRLEDARSRYLTTTFCYGCNLGPAQTARSIEGIDRKQVAYVNKKHINEEKLLKANVHIINKYNRFALPKYWGAGEKASADGTKWDVYEQNLLSEYHIRYGGWGGIGYYHVSDTYIALFSTFISCGVWEAVHILDGLLENESEIRPDTLHADTQGQSETVFGLAYLLGIKLMPRIRNWKDLTLYLPDEQLRLKHLKEVFTQTIDWELIQVHLPDMMRVSLSISLGRIRSSTILRKLNTYSRKSRLYFAFRELGRAVRTIFLMKYVASEELRRMINAATNTSEAWNGFIQWLAFGGHGVIGENSREEQRKMVRYNHLVGNLVIFHNVVAMTAVLQNLVDDGFEVNEEILGCLSPYRTAHINRFGNYELMERIPDPLTDKMKIKLS